MRGLSESDAVLQKALKDLEQNFSATGSAWRDQSRLDFDQAYIEPLHNGVRNAVRGIQEVNQILRKAIQDCSDSR